MKKFKSEIIFEKTLEAPHSSQAFTLRMVKQEYPDSINYVLERLDRHDAMGNEIWTEVSSSETYLAIETIGEFFNDLKTTNFKSLESIIKENKRLKEFIEIILAFHYKKDTSIDFDVSGQGERFLKKISYELFNDFYPDDDIIDELLKKHNNSI